jgi:hypothetical protein
MKQEQVQNTNTKKYRDEYDKKFDEIKSITSRTKQAYVPILCKLIKSGWPEYTNQEIQHKVLNDCEQKLGWESGHIYNCIPSEFRPVQKQVERRKLQKILNIERNNAPKIEQALKYFDKITEIPIKESPQEESEPVNDEELHDRGMGSYGGDGGGKTVFGIRNDIHQNGRMFFKTLCDGNEPPVSADEDLFRDYIKPTRDFRSTIAFESDQTERASLHNLMHNIIEIAEDMIDQIDKADKK